MIVTVARAFLVRGFQEAISYRAAFSLRLVTAAFSVAAFFFLSRFIGADSALLERYGGDYFSFGLVGVVMLNLQQTAVSVYPRTIRSAQLAGTLEAMLATPTPAWMVLVFSPLYHFCSSFLLAALYLVGAGLLLGVRFESANLASIAVTIPLCMLAFASIGFFSAAMTMLLRRNDALGPLIVGVSTLLGGVLYPTKVLPGWLEVAGRALPLTHALELVRLAALKGASLAELAAPLLGLALFCVVAVPLGLGAFGWTLARTRRDGSLTHF